MYVSFAILVILFFLLAKSVETTTLILVLLVAFPISYMMMFFYFLQFPTVKISRIGKEIDKEIVFAGRFLIVELESGVPLYDAMKNMNKSYPVVGAYFQEIVNKINVGTAMEDAISEGIDTSPSDSLTKILWQISNSLRTGSDISEPLKTVIETLVRQQYIAVNEYGRKLNPLAMFYMLIAIILPSLGVTMITVFSIFIGFELNLVMLLVIAGLVALVQLMFIAMVNQMRPPVEF